MKENNGKNSPGITGTSAFYMNKHIPALKIFSLLELKADKHPGDSALILPGGAVLTYRQMVDYVRSFATSLFVYGVARNSRVAVVLPNGPEMALSFLGITSVATCAPLNPSFSEEEFRFYLSDTGSFCILTNKNPPNAIINVSAELRIPVFTITPIEEIIQGADPIRPLQNLLIKNPSIDPEFSQPEDIALVLHTSGTTAKPKMVPLRQDRICRNAWSIASCLELKPEDRCLNVMPLFHVHGLIGCLLPTLFSGGSVITSPGFQPNHILSWLSDHTPTWYSAVPAIHHAMIRTIENRDSFTHTLRFIRSCSSPLPPVLLADLESVFHVPVIEAYGMTEASHQIASNPLPPKPHKPGSVGIPTGYKIKIIGSDDQELPVGSPGEVCISGQNLFSGYDQNPDANTKSFIGEFFRTGDEGYLDEDGYLFLTGRLKELINKGGEKIAPREIEEIALAIDGIDQAAVFSIPHPELGEDVGLIIVPKSDNKPDIQEIRRLLLHHLAPFKVPSRIWVRDEIPKGPTGKVRRREIAGIIESEASKDQNIPPEQTDEIPADIIRKISEIWEKSLNLDSIGLDDDFFALGGYSLSALAITLELEKVFNVVLPPTVLFEAPTIRRLALIISGKMKGEDISYLVSYQIKGSRIPLFLVPPGRGNAFYYRDLAEQLGDEQLFYSFSWLPSDSVSSIEEMAERYVIELLRVYPNGPLLLGGYCFGAVVALEMAHKLMEMGREIKCLFLLDPEILMNGPEWKYEPRNQTKRQWLEWLFKGGPRLWYMYGFGLICRRRKEHRLTEEERKQREQSISHLKMLSEYFANEYAGESVIVHYMNPNERVTSRWTRVCVGKTETICIPQSKHHEVLQKGMKEIVERINKYSKFHSAS